MKTEQIIRFLILILVGHLCYGNEINDAKNPVSDFLDALHKIKYVSYSKKDFAKFLVQCHKKGIQEDFRKGFGSNLNGADFSKLYLNGSIFNGVSLIGADFSHTDLSGVSFINSDLRGANFSNANLQGIKVKGTNLGFAKFISANLTDIILDQSDVSCAEFVSSDLKKVRMHSMTGLHTNFSDVKINFSSLSDSNVGYISFSDSEINNTVVQRSSLDNANFLEWIHIN